MITIAHSGSDSSAGSNIDLSAGRRWRRQRPRLVADARARNSAGLARPAAKRLPKPPYPALLGRLLLRRWFTG